MTRLRVLFADAQRSTADALSVALDATPDLQSAGVATTLAETIRLASSSNCDLVAIGDRLSDVTGLACGAVIRKTDPDVPLLMISAHESNELLTRVLNAGMTGLTSRFVSLPDLLNAIRVAAEGQIVANVDVQDSAPSFSPRQREVLDLMATGQQPAAIAEALFVSIHTARGHVKSVMRMLGASTQLEAVVAAMAQGFVLPPHLDAPKTPTLR